jgi:hypothetical protein
MEQIETAMLEALGLPEKRMEGRVYRGDRRWRMNDIPYNEALHMSLIDGLMCPSGSSLRRITKNDDSAAIFDRVALVIKLYLS